MESSLKMKSDRFVEIYSTLYKKYKWSENDMFLRLSSLIYARNGRSLNLDRFEDMVNYIKSNSSLFSPVRSSGRSVTAAILINNFEDPEEAFDSLISCSKILKENKFGRDIYAVLSAMVILLSGIGEDALMNRMERARNIYNLFKKDHGFITSHDDYPMAFALAGLDISEESIASRVEDFYSRLAALNFKKGSELQRLSQILTAADCDINWAPQKCAGILDAFKEYKMPYYRMNYIQMGTLSLLKGSPGEIFQKVREVYEYLKLNERSKFLMNKHLVAMLASDLVSSEAQEEMGFKNAVELGISSSLQAMVAAQQAAVIAAISAASTTAVISSSSN